MVLNKHLLIFFKLKALLKFQSKLLSWGALGFVVLTGVVAIKLSAILAGLLLACPLIAISYIYISYSTIPDACFAEGGEFDTAGKELEELDRFSLNADDIYPINLVTTFTKRLGFLRASRNFFYVSDYDRFVLFTPKCFWNGFQDGDFLTTGNLDDLRVQFCRNETWVQWPKQNEPILKEEWTYVTKYGDRDLRYKDNPMMYLVNRYWAEIQIPDHDTLYFGAFTKVYAHRFKQALSVIIPHVVPVENNSVDDEMSSAESEKVHDEDKSSDEAISEWYEVLEVT